MKKLLNAFVALSAVMVMAFAANAHAQQTPAEIVEQRIASLQDATDGRADEFQENPAELRNLLEEHIVPIADFRRISAMVMGQYYRVAESDQRQRFARVFQSSALDILTQGLLSINYEGLDVGNIDQEQRHDDQANVSVNVRATNGQVYPVNFTMLERDGEWRVINVIVNGINLGLTFRNQFDQAMRSSGRDFDAVIDSWDPSEVVEEIEEGGDDE